jgi:hypothetical protein
MFTKVVLAGSLFLSSTLWLPCSRAEALADIFSRVQTLVAARNYPRALEELTWAKKEIARQHTARLRDFLPDELAGYQGKAIETSEVMGISCLERTYANPTAKREVKVSLTGASGGEAAGGLEAFSQVSKLAAMFSGGSGRDTLRIEGKTTLVEADDSGRHTTLTIFLDSGYLLKLEASDAAIKRDDLKELATAFKLNELDAYAKGGK